MFYPDLFLVNLIQTGVIWEEQTSNKELSSSDCPSAYLWSIFFWIMIDVRELSADDDSAIPGQVILGCIRKHSPCRKLIKAFPLLLLCVLLFQLPSMITVQWSIIQISPPPQFALAYCINWKKIRRGSSVLQLLQNVSKSSVFSDPVKGRIFRKCHLQKGNEIIEGVSLKEHGTGTFLAVFCFLTLVMYYTTPDSE